MKYFGARLRNLSTNFTYTCTVAHKCHGTSKKLTARTKRSRHQQKDHGTNKKLTAPTRSSRHQQEAHGTNKKLTAPTKSSRHEQKTHGTRAKLSCRGLETNLKEYKNMADNFNEEDQVDEEGIVRYYFFRGFSYEEIRRLLQKNHAIEVSIRTLKRRIKSYGLRRRQPDYNIAHVRAVVENLLMAMAVYRAIDQCGTLCS